MNKLMFPLSMADGSITMGGLELSGLAQKHGTPVYVYDLSAVTERYRQLEQYFPWPGLSILYAMKANWNLDILRHVQKLGSHIDAVSPGDILMALKAGFSPAKILYTVNNIKDEEMDLAISRGVMFNVGSLSRLEKLGSSYPGSRICVRFNPDVVAGEHDHVKTGGDLAKFGILLEQADQVLAIAKEHALIIEGLHEHTGSGIADTDSVFRSMENLLSIAPLFPDLRFIDFGGGFKVRYSPDEPEIDYELFGKKVIDLFSSFCREYGRDLELFFEPGKFLAAGCGVMLVTVNTIRNNRGRIIAGVDSGLPHLIRPSFYGSYHHIVNVSNPEGETCKCDIVGNICESGDVFARDRELPEVREGDVLAIQNAGAYCYSMGSLYNLRPLPPEIVIENGRDRVSTLRVSFEQLVDRLA